MTVKPKTKTDRAELTRAELEIMQLLWQIERGVVHDLIERMEEPKPAYNTVSTIVRILEKKGFVGHKAYGKTYEYYPLITKQAYTSRYMQGVLHNFFDGSLSRLVSFFSAEQSITVEETDEILRLLKQHNEHKQ